MSLVILPHYYPEYNAWRMKQEELFIPSISFALGGDTDPAEIATRLARKFRCRDEAAVNELDEFVTGCMKGMGEFLDSENHEEYMEHCAKILSYMISGVSSRKGVKGLLSFVDDSGVLLAFLLEKYGEYFAGIPLTAHVEGKEDMDSYEKMCRVVLGLSKRLSDELKTENPDIREHEHSAYLLGMNIMILAHAARSAAA